jgi:hypothetical protein
MKKPRRREASGGINNELVADQLWAASDGSDQRVCQLKLVGNAEADVVGCEVNAVRSEETGPVSVIFIAEIRVAIFRPANKIVRKHVFSANAPAILLEITHLRSMRRS